MTAQALVVGATGKTGRYLVPDLVSRGLTVRAANRQPRPAGPGIIPVTFDWSAHERWDEALAGADRLYLIGPAFVVDPTAQVARFLDRAVRAGVTRVVYLSAWGVDQSESPLREVERAVEGSGLDWTILRPNWFTQNFSESFFTAAIRERDTVVAPSAGAAVSFIDVRDIAAVAAEAMTGDGHAGQGYTLSGPKSLTFGEVAEILSGATGRAIRHDDVSLDAFRAYVVAQGTPPEYAEILTGLFEYVIQPGHGAAVTPLVETITGRPAYDFADYAEDVADAWRERAA